jgi:mRNA-degrading endonuclease RelE of RelBE toxin-antitoxin system
VVEYDVIFSPSARREIKKLEKAVQKKVFDVLAGFRFEPRPQGVEKLTDRPKYFRAKVGGSHRMIYTILPANKIVVLVIRDRKSAYKNVKGLDKKLERAVSEIREEDRLRAAHR